MTKIKLTKGELKRQRDALQQFLRYLPTLQLRKQQLQLELLRQQALLQERQQIREKKRQHILAWIGLVEADKTLDLTSLIKIKQRHSYFKNIAGIDVEVFESLEFEDVSLDLFLSPVWVDLAKEYLREFVSLGEEIKVILQGIRLLKEELRIATQRVNLFEKIKIPQAQEAIRKIKIYLGDQMSNAVVRSKIAKRKIQSLVEEAVGV